MREQQTLAAQGRAGVIAEELARLASVPTEAFRRRRDERLRELVTFHAQNNPRYGALLRQAGVDAGDIRGVEDLHKLPFITKEHLLEDAPWGFVSVPRNELVTFLETSGSTGKPKYIPVSHSDKRRIFEMAARAFYLGGFRADSPILAILPRGPWPASFFAQDGCELIGPTLRGEFRQPLEWMLRTMETFRPRYLVSSPSFMGKLVQDGLQTVRDGGYSSALTEPLRAKGTVDQYFRQLGLTDIILGGEKMGRTFRQELEQALGARVWSVYGCAETGVMAIECSRHKGLHYFSDEIILETLDSTTLRPVAPGQDGELVITVLYKNALPIIRYRMRDVAAVYGSDPARCECGVSLPLMSLIHGRSDDMLKVGGGNIYPEFVWEAVARFDELNRSVFQLEVASRGLKDQLRLRVELKPGATPREGLARQMVQHLRSSMGELNVVLSSGMVEEPIIEFMKPGELYSGQGKLQRFVSVSKG